jgi:hypothetical protein
LGSKRWRSVSRPVGGGVQSSREDYRSWGGVLKRRELKKYSVAGTAGEEEEEEENRTALRRDWRRPWRSQYRPRETGELASLGRMTYGQRSGVGEGRREERVKGNSLEAVRGRERERERERERGREREGGRGRRQSRGNEQTFSSGTHSPT